MENAALIYRLFSHVFSMNTPAAFAAILAEDEYNQTGLPTGNAFCRLPQTGGGTHTALNPVVSTVELKIMEPGIVLAVLGVLGIPIALTIWLIARTINARDRIEELSHRLGDLEAEISQLKKEASWLPTANVAPTPIPITPPTTVPSPPTAETRPEQKIVIAQASPFPPPTLASPPRATEPKSIPPMPALPPPTPPQPAPKINWEQFMGVKMFAWVGGLALFLGVAFFVKYSFDNNLVPPQVRIAIGFLTGLGLLVGGVVMSRRDFAALSQTLCATGIVVLYAVTFACRTIYHFLSWSDTWWDALPAFGLMVLVTATGFFLAVRLNALVVAILGMLGGFLTPVLINTNQDNPLGLFGYIAILDAGLIFVALNKRWHFLTALGALGTVFMQVGWADHFFVSEKYFEGSKILIALAVLLGFNVLYLAANWWAKRRTQSNWWLADGNLALAAVALAFTAFFFTFPPLAERPGLLFSFVFLIDLAVAALAWLDEEVSPAQPAAGLAVFGLLALWMANSLTKELLNPVLAFCLVFAVFHSALPALLQRRRGMTADMSAQLNHFFPPLALLLVLVPIFKLEEPSFLIWPFVLLVDLLAMVLAVMTATLLPVLAVLLLTLAATGALIFKIPSDLNGLPTSFFLLGAFAVFFVVAGVWLARKFKPDAFKSGLKIAGDINSNETMAALLPASSAVLPFLLLIMATLRLPLANPSPVFGLALLLVVLLLGLAKIFSFDWMPLVGLCSTFAVECAWHLNRFDLANFNRISPQMLVGWYLIFFAAFAMFPFVFQRKFADKIFPWVAAALAGPAQFLLIYRLVKIAWPNSAMGLLPAAFAVPGLLSLVMVLKKIPAENQSRLAQLAWFVGVSLFFITLIFPVQFDR